MTNEAETFKYNRQRSPIILPLLDAIKESSISHYSCRNDCHFLFLSRNVLQQSLLPLFTVDTGIAKTFALSVFEMTSGVQSATEHFYSDSDIPFLNRSDYFDEWTKHPYASFRHCESREYLDDSIMYSDDYGASFSCLIYFLFNTYKENSVMVKINSP